MKQTDRKQLDSELVAQAIDRNTLAIKKLTVEVSGAIQYLAHAPDAFKEMAHGEALTAMERRSEEDAHEDREDGLPF